MDFRYKILVAEDDESLRFYINTIVEKCGFAAISAASGSDAEIMVSSHCPDVVLLDLGFPDKDGMDVLRNIREWSDVPVIIISSRQNERAKVAALEKGADDYIAKPFSDKELMARIRVALRHNNNGVNVPVRDEGRYCIGNMTIDYDKYKVFISGNNIELTQNEYKLVALLGHYAGRVLPYEYLIHKLWGPNNKRNNQILRVNMTNIRRKLENDPAHPQYFLTEMGIGYYLRSC